MSQSGAYVLMMLLAGGLPLFAQDFCPKDANSKGNPPVAADQFVRQAIDNELRAQDSDHSHWTYEETKTQDGKVEVREVYATQFGNIDRLLELNGSVLNVQQEEDEKVRIRKLPRDSSQMQKNLNQRHDDWQREEKMLQVFPNAFLYCYAGSDGGVVKLKYAPNPNFRPDMRLAQVLHHLQGVMFIDRKQMRLAGIDGTLISEVEFGGGLLGRLDEGGTFSLRMKDVGGGNWRPVRIEAHMSGRALLFKTIAVEQSTVFSDYRQIADTMTLQEAASVLESAPAEPSSAPTEARKD